MARPTRTPVQRGEHAKGTAKGCVDSEDGGATAIGIVCASVAIGRGAGAAGADYLGVRRGHGCQLIVELDVGVLQPERAHEVRHRFNRRRSLLTVERILAGVEVADHFDHEGPFAGGAVVAGRARRREVPVAPGPQPALGVDGEMLREVAPAVLLHVELAHGFHRR